MPPSITDPNDSDSDTEPEDEADEDSNGLFSCFQSCNFARSTRLFAEEEYYKNDYPEEDSSSNASDGSGASFAVPSASGIRSCQFRYVP